MMRTAKMPRISLQDTRQIFEGINADMDLRGINNADVAGNFGYFANATLDLTHNAGDDTLYANTGDDILEGRQGNDLLSGGRGHDDFFQLKRWR